MRYSGQWYVVQGGRVRGLRQVTLPPALVPKQIANLTDVGVNFSIIKDGKLRRKRGLAGG